MAGLIVDVTDLGILRSAHPHATRPNPAAAAVLTELAGAEGVAVQIGPGQGPITTRDLQALRATVHRSYILRMPPTNEALGTALDIKPDMVALLSTDNDSNEPIDLALDKALVTETVSTLQMSGIPAILVLSPNPRQIKMAHQMGISNIEIDTLPFCRAATPNLQNQIFSQIVDAMKLAHRLKFHLFAGRGLDYRTIGNFAGMPEIDMFIVGHTIISQALMTGLPQAVREVRELFK